MEAFIIFARGGIILFSWTAVALKGSPVDALVSNVLLEERSGKSDYTYTAGATKYTLKWSFHNELGLVFVAVRAPLPLVASLYTTPCAQLGVRSVSMK